jgi:autotransporter-associated beta strand protein
LVFTPDSNANYISTNVVNRASGVSRTLLQQGHQDLPGLGEVMLNEIRLQGVFNGGANRNATLNGKPLMFVNNLSGGAPTLRLDATQTGAFQYTYNVDMDLILYHDFVIEGDGNANFRIGGDMRSFDPASGVRKRGASIVTLTGHNNFTGPAIVDGGAIVLSGTDAALDGAAEVQIKAGARLTMQDGLIRTERFDVSQGVFEFLGGTLQANEVVGSLANSVGTVVVGAAPQTVAVSGNYVQSGGTLTALVDGHLTGPSSTIMSVAGLAQLGGTLFIDFDGTSPFPVGSSLRLLHAAGGITGAFSQVQMSMLPAGSQWAVEYGQNSVTLSRLANAFNSADFDFDGDIDGADFLAWQRNVGTVGPMGDANADGAVNALDLNVLKAQFGQPAPSLPASQPVPEPAAVLMCVAALLVTLGRRRVTVR